MKVRKIRDLSLIELTQDKTLVVACDSCGGAGMKAGDVLQVSPRITGQFTARVVLFEVLCAGAEVVCLTNTVCNEMENTGKDVRYGIEAELIKAGIDQVVLTGSTEENFATISTGIGITAIGIAHPASLKINRIDGEAELIAFGQPKVGAEILTAKAGEIANYDIVQYLLAQDEVCEIVPVGSKGILHEARELAKYNQLELQLEAQHQVDIEKSAGPCSVILAAVRAAGVDKMLSRPYAARIGKLLHRL